MKAQVPIFGLIALAIAGTILPASTHAQSEGSVDDLEEIVVTGSRIKRLDANLATPVQIYDATYIEATGAADMQDFLFTSSFAGPSLFNENQTLAQTAGTANFDSRGFGDDYVVVLLNGRRLPADPLGGDSATNINLIPIGAVERVEYLSTGASAVYGADAVQGVINVITKQEYEGLSARLRYDSSVDGDGPRTGLAVTGGIVGPSGFATVSFEYQAQDDVDTAGLPLISSAVSPAGDDNRSPTGLPGTYVDFGTGVSYPAPDCPQSSVRPAQFTSVGSDCAYDFALLYDAIPAQQLYNFLMSAEYSVADGVAAYGEFRFSRNFTEVRNGAAPAFFNITGAPSLANIDAQLGTDLANSPAVFILRRAVDAGPRARDATNTAFSSLIGARFEFGEEHELDMSFQNVESEMNQIGVGGNLSVSNIEAAVASGVFDPTQTYDPTFFEDNGLAISTQRQATGTENRFAFDFNGRMPIELGAGPIGYAAGVHYTDRDFFDRADVASTEGDVAGGASSNGDGEMDVTSIYTEFALLPFEQLEISVAGRYDDYGWTGAGTTGSDAEFTYMAGLSFRPVDNLLLRASYGTGFKAPTLGQLFLGRSFGVVSAVDTTLCNAAQSDPGSTQADIDNACRSLEIRSVQGGNANLSTESSENYGVGFVFDVSDQWSVALDYYNIRIEDKIGSLSVQEILNNEAAFPNLVARVNGSLSVPGAEVRSNLQNLNSQEGQGIDVSTRYSWEFDAGKLVGDLRMAYLMSHERQTSATQPLCEYAGTTSEPEWRINGQLGWEAEKWNAVLTARYLGETEDWVGGRDAQNRSCDPNPSGSIEAVDSYLELGLRGTYQFSDDTEFSLGIINLTDEDPVFSSLAAGGWPWYDQSLYDPRGMRFYANLSHSFF